VLVVKRNVSHKVSFFHPPKCVNFSLFDNSWMSGSILQVINAISYATQDEVVCASNHITQDEFLVPHHAMRGRRAS